MNLTENKLALPDRVLLQVEKPARYTGGEVNSIVKEKSDSLIRFCMCFPDLYEIGMSNLGVQIIYSLLNEREDVWCERCYCADKDLFKIMKSEDIPLFALESQDAVRDFDFLGISLQYEMAYTNILQILDLSKIPFMSTERGEADPIVIAGGPCTYNPEPVADFFDIIYIGEGETSYYPLMDAYKENIKRGGGRVDFLKLAANIPGLYVPQFYDVTYNGDGTLKSFAPKKEYENSVPLKIKRQVVKDLDNVYYPRMPIVPFVSVVQERSTLEIQRGCIRGCRFCQAGMVYRPLRIKSLDTLKKDAAALINNTGYDEITLSSLSSSDFPYLKELVEYLAEEFKDRNVNISLPSLRIDEFSLDVMEKVQDIKKSSLTFAPEAGSQRLRDVINKGITEPDIMHGASLAFKGGWNKVKLYFMLGLPTESKNDILEIPELAERLSELYFDVVPKEERAGRCQITVSTSFFIPKPFTPFQWEPMLKAENYNEKAHMLNDHIREMKNKKSLRYIWHDVKTSIIEGFLARGDRRCARAVKAAYEKGAMLDAWTENFDYDLWEDAINESGLSLDFYVYRKRDVNELLPWDFIDAGVSRKFLINEFNKASRGEVTPNCRDKCSGCGCTVYGCGLCLRTGL